MSIIFTIFLNGLNVYYVCTYHIQKSLGLRLAVPKCSHINSLPYAEPIAITGKRQSGMRSGSLFVRW